MGYTHYWTHKRRFTAAQWSDITRDVTAILALVMPELPLADGMGENPLPTPEYAFVDLDNGPGLNLNGMGDDSQESFSIYRNRRPLESWQEPARRGGDFCKTERKPYDSVVTAILCYLESVYPDQFSAGSDGTAEDWQAGLAVARRALPRLDNVLRIPVEVAFDSQWSQSLLAGNKLAAMVRLDGAICITKGLAIVAAFPAGASADEALAMLQRMAASDPARRGWVKTDQRARWADKQLRTVWQMAQSMGAMVED